MRDRSRLLGRRKATREPRRRFIIFCEGKNTEPLYFAALRRICAAALIEIETLGGVGVPFTVAQNAVARAKELGIHKRRRKLDSFEEKDQVWAVFDRDAHPRYEDAIALCTSGGVGVARSNPCFELWLVLHDVDYDKPDERHALQAFLKSIRPEYDPKNGKSVDCHELIHRIELAEARALRQLLRRQEEGLPFGPPSTSVGSLTRAIRDAVALSK